MKKTVWLQAALIVVLIVAGTFITDWANSYAGRYSIAYPAFLTRYLQFIALGAVIVLPVAIQVKKVRLHIPLSGGGLCFVGFPIAAAHQVKYTFDQCNNTCATRNPSLDSGLVLRSIIFCRIIQIDKI